MLPTLPHSLHDPLPQGRHGEEVERLGHQRFIDAFVLQSSRSQLTVFPVMALMAYICWQPQHTGWPLAWLAAGSLLALWRLQHTEKLVRSGDPALDARRIRQMLLASGLMLSLPLLWFQTLSDNGRSLLSLVIITVATVSVVTTSGYRGMFMWFAAPMLLSLTLAWALNAFGSGQGIAAALAATTLMLLLFLRSLGRYASAVFMEGCAYRLAEQQSNQQLKAALAEADEANHAKTQFLAAASHDLRQPIHSMNILVAALSLRALDAPSREIVALLGSVNQVLSKQLDTLLDISKLDAGVVQAQPAPCSLDQLVRAHHAVTLPLAAQLGLNLRLQVGEAVWVHTDAALMARALSNLSDNALKYTPRGGTVRLIVRAIEGQALLEVQDSGIGIAKDEQERVFREFYQVGNIERDRNKGLGLGLSIVQRLCTLLAVQLSLQSQPGQGTCVTLRLPQVAAQAPAAPIGKLPPQPRGLRVLVVDDEAMVRDSMRWLLEALECQVFLADGTTQATEVAATQPLDLVLSDFRLQAGASGLAAIEAVRAHQPQLCAVLITGDTAPDRIREAQAAGVPLLFKPVSLEDLIDVLPQPRDSAAMVPPLPTHSAS